MNNQKSVDILEMALDWMELIDQMGPFAPLDKLQCVYDSAPQEIWNTNEYWYVSGLLQGRRGYNGLPDAAISPEEHLSVLDHIAHSSALYGYEMAEQAAGLHDGYSIALGFYGDTQTIE